MKKSLFLIIALVMALGFCLTACGGNNNNTPDADENTTHSHNFGGWITIKKATCVENGEMARYCECGEKQTETLFPTGEHTEITDKAVDPTCTEAGFTEGSHCSVCNLVIVAQTAIKANGHTEVVDEAVAPSCTEPGLTEGKHCSVCNEVLVKQGTAPIVPHTYDDIYDESCNVCNDIRDTECGHKESVAIPGYSSSCTEPGLTEGQKCKKCGEILVHQSAIEAKGHTEVIDEAIAATCTEAGLTEGKHCSACEAVLVAQQVVKAPGHSFDTPHIFDSSFHWLKCKNCDEITNKSEHIAGDSGECSVCGEQITSTPGVIYKLSYDKKYAIVEGYTGSANNILLSDTYEGVPVECIGNGAFANSSITSIVLPESITTIEREAFSGCVNLSKINIPSAMKYISSDVFYGCNKLLLNTYKNASYIGNDDNPYMIFLRADDDYRTSYTIHYDTKIIAPCAFNYNIESVIIPAGVTYVSDFAFQWCNNLIIYCEAAAKPLSWGGEWNYSDYSSPRPVIWGVNNITTNSTFNYVVHNEKAWLTSYKSSSTYLKVPSQIDGYKVESFGNIFGESLSINHIEISEGIERIEPYAFYSNSNVIQYVYIPDTVTYIGEYAFHGAGFVTVIPSSVSVIGAHAFYQWSDRGIYCGTDSAPAGWSSEWTNKEDVTWAVISGIYNDMTWISTDGKTASIVDGYVYYLSELNIPSQIENLTVTTIEDEAFAYRNVGSVIIPETITTIGYNAFVTLNGFYGFKVHEDNPSYKALAGSLYTKDGKILIQATQKSGSFVIPNGVEKIEDYALSFCRNINSVTIPNTVKTIGHYAFYGCSSLENIIFEENSQLEIINSYAFYQCNYTKITIPDSVKIVGERAFYGNNIVYNQFDNAYYIGSDSNPYFVLVKSTNNEITSVTVHPNTVFIDSSAFINCESLISVVIGDSITSIGNNAFNGCSALRDVYYTGSEEQWKEITIGRSNSALTNTTKHYNYVAEN